MTTLNDAFSLGVTYWPRQAGPLFWQRYDRGAVRDELAHIAALGFDTVRLCLVWEDFQPGPTRINSRAMRSLEHALDVAHTVGLRVVLALFPVATLGQLQIPAWANGPDILGVLQRVHRRQSLLIVRPPGLVPVLSGGRYRPVQCGDLFSEPMIVEAQRYLVREVAGYFGDHPAVRVWQVGEGFERVHRPESDQAADRWLETIGEELRQVAPRAVCMGVVSPVGLKRRSGPRPEDVAKRCACAGVVVDPPETPIENQMRHTNPAAYLHMLAAGLAERRMVVIGVGMPTTTEGESAGWFEDDLFGQTMILFPDRSAIQHHRLPKEIIIEPSSRFTLGCGGHTDADDDHPAFGKPGGKRMQVCSRIRVAYLILDGRFRRIDDDASKCTALCHIFGSRTGTSF